VPGISAGEGGRRVPHHILCLMGLTSVQRSFYFLELCRSGEELLSLDFSTLPAQEAKVLQFFFFLTIKVLQLRCCCPITPTLIVINK